ncbi:MAG: sulfite exporter TauE/SafE family protein [Candidatus Margulisbacteria bacterium]|nr:sulfite exporter TauE/SafE family protein [Candidatus Margulisiibacteriota bacterium]
MSSEFYILMGLAASIGFGHTIMGPDHYLPFVMMSKARNWSFTKTSIITFLCGVGHVLSSVVLGLIGIALGIAVANLEFVESIRGELAAWFLIGFGFLYFIWGMRNAIKNKEHVHFHVHADGTKHIHTHAHETEHLHVHQENKKDITPWVLFTIFVFGPCEPLIPLLMYPAAKGSVLEAILVAVIFSVVTISTMMVIVLAGSFGLKFVVMKRLEKYGSAIAGAVICLSGLAIKFLGL